MCSLYGVRVGWVQGSAWRGGLSVLPTPLVVLSARGMCAVPCFSSQHPAVAPDSSEAAVGLFLVFACLFIHCTCTQWFLVPFKFLCILLLEETTSLCPGTSTAAKGPRSQPVSGGSPTLPVTPPPGGGTAQGPEDLVSEYQASPAPRGTTYISPPPSPILMSVYHCGGCWEDSRLAWGRRTS